jgi:hypothetical protein
MILARARALLSRSEGIDRINGQIERFGRNSYDKA